MPIDYSLVDQVVELTFDKLDKPSARLDFPSPGTLSTCLNEIIGKGGTLPILPHTYSPLLATAGIEMWHRAIHSFLWSLALTDKSPLWASVSGYYSSHFVMRAFAHSMGIFKSFTQRKAVQVSVNGGHFVCAFIESRDGEHPFYWKAVKGHPKLTSNPLFRENSERNLNSDSAHRTFANYTDHLGSFVPLTFPSIDEVASTVESISRIRLHSITEPSRDDYPDLQNVQILAFQRIIAFHDFLDDRVAKNRFWRAHKRPQWCKNLMVYQVEEQGLEAPHLS